MLDVPSSVASESDSESSIASNGSWHNLPPKIRTLNTDDSVQYYIPGGMGGSPDDYRVGTILSIVKDQYPLVLSTGDFLDKDHHVSKLCLNAEPNYWGTYAPIGKYRRVRGGTIKHYDVLLDLAGTFSSIMNNNRRALLEQASQEGYAPMDAVRVLKGGRTLKPK